LDTQVPHTPPEVFNFDFNVLGRRELSGRRSNVAMATLPEKIRYNRDVQVSPTSARRWQIYASCVSGVQQVFIIITHHFLGDALIADESYLECFDRGGENRPLGDEHRCGAGGTAVKREGHGCEIVSSDFKICGLRPGLAP